MYSLIIPLKFSITDGKYLQTQRFVVPTDRKQSKLIDK